MNAKLATKLNLLNYIKSFSMPDYPDLGILSNTFLIVNSLIDNFNQLNIDNEKNGKINIDDNEYVKYGYGSLLI